MDLAMLPVVPELEASQLQPSAPSPGLFRIPLLNVAPTAFENAADLHSLLEKKSRELGGEIRLLEHQRQHLRSLEKQREYFYVELSKAVTSLTDSSNALNGALGDAERTIAAAPLFEENRKALDVLENVSVALITNFQCWRSAWEQYVPTCKRVRDLKAEMSAVEPLVDA
jgi:hypothetical protein